MTESLTPEERIAKALGFAGAYGTTDGGHHKMWVIDQMVRALTGCPPVTKEAVDYKGRPYTYEAQGESAEYLRFTGAGDDWDEGIAP